MFRIPAPLKTLGTSACNSITQPLAIVSALAETGAAHAEAYRDNQIEAIELNKVERRKVSAFEVRARTAERICNLEDKLNGNDRLAEIFTQLGSDDFDVSSLLERRRNPVILHAAE